MYNIYMTKQNPQEINSKWRDTTNAVWMRSALASESDETIVEVAQLEDGIHAVRDGRAPEKGVLYFTEEEWQAFQRGVKAGEFDSSSQQNKTASTAWVPSPYNNTE